jgi:hypothetical protein
VKIHYLLIGIACLGLQASTAEEAIKAEEGITYDAPCFDTNELFAELKIKFKETPIILGNVSDQAKSTMSLWINPVEETWTIISTKKDTSCVIGTGVDFKLVPYKKGSSI